LGVAVTLALLAAGCNAGEVGPARLDTKNETCRSCRMPVSDARLASQLVAPLEEPKFFDDLSCLRDFLERFPSQPKGTVAYVCDYRTGEWVPSSRAVYARAGIQTPMGSGLVAHSDERSRAADRGLAEVSPVSPAELFGNDGPPGAERGQREKEGTP
jgi:copper chaperone NosL